LQLVLFGVGVCTTCRQSDAFGIPGGNTPFGWQRFM
jgi:hypothetical protein